MDPAASIIAFVQAAAGITKCIVKTYQLWHEIKDIPGDIEEMLDEMEAIGEIFADIETDLTTHPDSGFRNKRSGEHTTKLALKTYKNLQQLALDMDSEIKAKKGLRKMVKLVKIRMGNDKLEGYQRRLERALQSLQLVLDMYQLSVARETPERVSKRVTTDLISYLESTASTRQLSIKDDNESEDDEAQDGSNVLVPRANTRSPTQRSYAPSKLGRFVLAYKQNSGAWQAYLQWPSWLSQSVFEVISRPSMAGWTYSYRVYNVVPYKSEILQKVEKGDANGVLELFRTRKASPFDRDEHGDSLLHHAASSKKYDICQLLLNLGLQECLVEGVQESPVSQFVFWPLHTNPQPADTAAENHWERIVELFHSYLEDPESNLVLQIFDYLQEWAYDDRFLLTFRERFLPKWYIGPLRNRLEAFRHGSFIVKSDLTLLRLLSETREVSTTDVLASTHDKLSLVHSTAIALGARFADVNLPYKRVWLKRVPYREGWSYLVQKVASASCTNDLHAIETITPWDVHHVPVWRGTPLVSVIGGVLCYLSPEISFTHWDMVFQTTLQRWVSDLQAAGVDLMAYGQEEKLILKTQLRGALDADAIASSRHVIRHVISGGVETLRGPGGELQHYSDNYWVPIRIFDLEVGPDPADWRIIWAPEFEWMANQFWKLVGEESVIMPGSWVEG